MYIAHKQLPWGESAFHVGNSARELFSLLTESYGHEMVGFYCTDDNWEGAALTLGNIEQIEVAQTGHWRTSVGDKVAICNYPDDQPVNRIEALRGAVEVAAQNDKLVFGMDFSGVEMDQIRRDWKGLNFAQCNLSGAEFTGCEMGQNEFIECDMRRCWLPVSESENIRFNNCVFEA